MEKNRYIMVDDIMFPILEVDGITIIDYPTPIANKITEEGKKHVEQLMKLLKKANPDIEINNKPWKPNKLKK